MTSTTVKETIFQKSFNEHPDEKEYDNISTGDKKVFKSAGESKTQGCCLDIVKFVFCGFIPCKRDKAKKYTSVETEEKNLLDDLNENNSTEKQPEETGVVDAESDEEKKLLSNIANVDTVSNEHVVVCTPIEKQVEQTEVAALIKESQVNLKQSTGDDNCDKELVHESVLNSTTTSSESGYLSVVQGELDPGISSRYTPEGSELVHDKSEDKNNLQLQKQQGDMTASVGINQFYTLVSEVGLKTRGCFLPCFLLSCLIFS